MNNGHSILRMLIGFVVGGLVAASIALLTAPKSGEETRQMIKEGFLDAQKKVNVAIEDTREKVIDTMGDAGLSLSSRASAMRHNS